MQSSSSAVFNRSSICSRVAGVACNIQAGGSREAVQELETLDLTDLLLTTTAKPTSCRAAPLTGIGWDASAVVVAAEVLIP